MAGKGTKVLVSVVIAVVVFICIVVFALMFTGKWSPSRPTQIKVYEETLILRDGEYMVLHLEPGTYEVIATSDEEVAVTVIALGLEDRGTYIHLKFTLTESSALKILNPTIFGLGPSATVTVTIYRSI